jgi:6-phosphofructokinase 1
MNRIGILTGGGDAPGLNAVIRAAVKTARGVFGAEVLGIKQGFEGILDRDGTVELTHREVRGILPHGGTILGTANRGNPFARRIKKNGEEVVEDASDEVAERIKELGLDAIIVVGGDGTLRISLELFEKGCPIIGVPKTIDNDVGGTDGCFGFDTAVATATEAIDRLHTTAEAHHRVMVIELMGRDAGFIALGAGLAGGADVILIPEIPFELDTIYKKVRDRAESGRNFSIISVAEGAYEKGGKQIFLTDKKGGQAQRFGGIGYFVSQSVTENCAIESRVTVLGHLQRGGSPTAYDRWLATRFGAAAVRLAKEKKYGRMVALMATEIRDVSLKEALAEPKRVDIEGDAVRTARDLGICLGDS